MGLPNRKSDVGLLMTILTMIGALYIGFGKPATWDQAAKDVDILKPKVSENSIQIARLNQAEEDHFIAIMSELKAINKKVGR